MGDLIAIKGPLALEVGLSSLTTARMDQEILSANLLELKQAGRINQMGRLAAAITGIQEPGGNASLTQTSSLPSTTQGGINQRYIGLA